MSPDSGGAEIVDRVVSLARARLTGAKGEMAASFLSAYYANAAAEDLAESADDLYGAAMAVWQLGRVRRPGTPKIRVYTPRRAEHGWESPHSVVEIVNDDMPFLVDSVLGQLTLRELTVHRLLHPIVMVKRNGKGEAVGCGDGAAESFMHIEIDHLGAEQSRAALEADIVQALADVRAAVADWKNMLARMRDVREAAAKGAAGVPQADVATATAFLDWLVADNFTFLGYRHLTFAGSGEAARMNVAAGSGLGILRDDAVMLFDGLRELGGQPAEVQAFVRSSQPLLVTKSSRRATVHRAVHIDAVGVKVYDSQGAVSALHLFAGLFTSAAYSQSPREIPLLREKVAAIITRAGFASASHNAKSLAHVLETYPRDELIQASPDELFETAMGILRLKERQRTALFVRREAFGRFVSALVYVPRDRFTTDLRVRIQRLLEEAYGGPVSAFYTTFAEDTILVRVHYIVKTGPSATQQVATDALSRRITEASRGFEDRLREAFVASHGEEQGLVLLKRYATALPFDYRDRFDPRAIAADLKLLEPVREGATKLSVHLYRTVDGAENELRLRLVQAGNSIPLSDVLPILENLGCRVLTEEPWRVQPAGAAEALWMQDILMVAREVPSVDLAQMRAPFEEAFRAAWAGNAANDGFNRLVLAAGMKMREIVVLRAYAKYLRQLGITYSQSYMEDALAQNAQIARQLIALFRLLHDPARPADAEDRAGTLVMEIEQALDAVTNLDQDRILRRYVNLIRATMRTNWFQLGADGQAKPWVSFKIDSRAIDEMPLPRPLVEIWVYSPDVEAVHLRGGRVARGGIRWSDRPEDFRTEILGLMKAQMVKNSVIVPVGSKGGFNIKRPPAPEAGREAYLNYGIECYRTMMRGLLDVTDSISPSGIVKPKDVVRRDDDDPYLVVAADKGTATFSDIANSISRDYRFWLDDAFASGGSAGYDHKVMGITSRGAWEAVKRHFRELGVDTQTNDFTVVGVGDMSGDVFGNGMLRSKHIKLLAAFDHRHIFIDPEPDCEKSYAERDRLFRLPRSSWLDYDKTLISAGGGVFDRKAKSVRTTPQIRALFGVDESVTPNELMRAILKMPADLLFFGGIGTFVKAGSESHAEAGDRANEALRIDATEIRAKVVGEGANLGVTQRARIEYAQHGGPDGKGGRINTDAIDNSAGVDTSDHEVNIKILLGDVVARGDMTLKQRDELMRAMTDEVGQLVLRDNYLQSQVLSLVQRQGVATLDQAARLMRLLEKSGRLNRAIEFLPDDEALRERQSSGAGLTRPEIAVLLAYAKLALYDALLPSDLPDDPILAEDLIAYFPTKLRSSHEAAIGRHRLKREIIATVVTNELINRLGPFFVAELVERGAGRESEIARAWRVARDVLGLPALWATIEALDNKAPSAVQYRMMALTQDALARAITWFLAQAPIGAAGARQIDVAQLRERFTSGLAAMPAAASDEEQRALEAEGAPAELAAKVASLANRVMGLDAVRLAAGGDIARVAEAYFAVGERLSVPFLARAAERLKRGDGWARRAGEAVQADLAAQQADATRRALETGVDGWSERNREALGRLDALVAELKTQPRIDLAALTVAAREMRALTSG